MSGKVVGWAFEQGREKELSPVQRYVLIAYGDNASESGKCWPDKPEIVEKTGLSRATVYRAIKALEGEGLIVFGEDGKGRLCVQLAVPWNSQSETGKSQSETEKSQGETGTNKGTVIEPTEGSRSSSTSKEVHEVWENHEALFGTPKGKGLTPSRARVIEKALAEFSVDELKRASAGLKRFRETKPGSTEIASAFSTNPRTGPLVERIGFWIEQADRAPQGDDLDVEQVRREQGLE